MAPFPRSAAEVIHRFERRRGRCEAAAPDRQESLTRRREESAFGDPYAFAEALRRDPDKQPRWVVLVDGEPNLYIARSEILILLTPPPSEASGQGGRYAASSCAGRI